MQIHQGFHQRRPFFSCGVVVKVRDMPYGTAEHLYFTHLCTVSRNLE